jgi:hypothetical protein
MKSKLPWVGWVVGRKASYFSYTPLQTTFSQHKWYLSCLRGSRNGKKKGRSFLRSYWTLEEGHFPKSWVSESLPKHNQVTEHCGITGYTTMIAANLSLHPFMIFGHEYWICTTECVCWAPDYGNSFVDLVNVDVFFVPGTIDTMRTKTEFSSRIYISTEKK